jgi:hypothetical protein
MNKVTEKFDGLYGIPAVEHNVVVLENIASVGPDERKELICSGFSRFQTGGK